MGHLTPSQFEQFTEEGYIIIREAFDPDFARRWTQRAWDRLGYDPQYPSTWAEARIHMPTLERRDVPDIAPDVWLAVCELLGGEERIKAPFVWSDAFIVNLREGADDPWQAPHERKAGWHKDGDFFRHFLDSPEQGLLTIVLWSDVVHQGGPTYIAPQSIGLIARYLAEHPEGRLPNEFPIAELIDQCDHFVEATGNAGDVYLMHPYMLHTVSQNVLRRPRFITNPPVQLNEPMNFNRPDPESFSAVERAVLRGLGRERLDFKPAAPREAVVPERIKRQARMLEEEKARLAARGGK
ncbi:MAG: phytanoyl-CoA dioxygenase family protein [Phycisphaeraceae bacterium]|nr:phytanoyl-CoA dioxygenase family protein [Phycisphaeraceae bacterium]